MKIYRPILSNIQVSQL